MLGASGFVASSAITMTYSGEPVTDGDADVNTNYSIDFGYNRITLGNLVWEDLNNDGLVSDLDSAFGQQNGRNSIEDVALTAPGGLIQ